MIKKVIIAGQKPLAESLFKLCLKHDLTVIKCFCPEGDKYLRPLAKSMGVDVLMPEDLTAENISGADIGFTAHYFGFIGSSERQSAKLGWLGYHPSLLPLYKGKNSIIDTVNSQDRVIGGSLYWLSDKMDGGDIAYQEFIPIDKSAYNSPNAIKNLWINTLSPLGLTLFERAIIDLKYGIIHRHPQKTILK